MRGRYGSAEQFLKLFTPDLQIATARNEARAYLGSAPSLAVLAEGYGWQTVIVWLCIMIENLNNFTGVREKMPVARQRDLATLILAEYPSLKASEILLFSTASNAGATGVSTGWWTRCSSLPRSCNSASRDARTSSDIKKSNRVPKNRLYRLPTRETTSHVKNISNKNDSKKTKMDKDRIYGHAELALLYFKNIQPKSASTQLARWIRRDEELWEELLLAGYRKGQKVFTPLQVTILVDHLGDPETWTIK